MLEKTLKSPLDNRQIQPVYPKGNQSWIFIGRTDAEAETPKLWPPDAKRFLIWKDPDAGKDWRWEVGEGDSRGWDSWMASPTQWIWVWVSSGSWWWTEKPVCCSPWSRKKWDMTEWLTELKWSYLGNRSLSSHCIFLVFNSCKRGFTWYLTRNQSMVVDTQWRFLHMCANVQRL